MRLAWVTDPHLNFVDTATRRLFLSSLAMISDAVVISGDIGESSDVEAYLTEAAHFLKRPVYFVLGNHDFYRGSIAKTREAVTRLAEKSEYLVYLTAEDVVELTPRSALIGHDGWADGRLGDLEHSEVLLNDYFLIGELRRSIRNNALDKPRLSRLLSTFGDQAAKQLGSKLTRAACRYPGVTAVTHVPPFREAAWHEGRISDDDWLPHFSCKAAGDAMLKVMQRCRESNLMVLCGHTHGVGETRPADNLLVLTGGATYGAPEVQRVFEIE